ADLVAHDSHIAAQPVAMGQKLGCSRQGRQTLEMDTMERLVEHLLGVAGAFAEQRRKSITQRAVRAVTHLLCSPRRLAQRHESIAIAFDDGRPGVDQRVVPVEQDGPWWSEIGQPAHVTVSPSAAKRTYSSRRRRAVGPTLPSPTASPSIFTTGVTNDVADVMKASCAALASANVKGRSTSFSCSSPASDFRVWRVMPARIALSVARVTSSPPLVTIQALVEAPSVTWPLPSTSHASYAPLSRAACLASTLGSSATVLMSQRPHRMSGWLFTAMPGPGSAPARLLFLVVSTSAGFTGLVGKA